MDKDEVELQGLDLKNDPEFISVPYLEEPLYKCAKSVTARGFMPRARIEIEIEGNIEISQNAGFPEPHGATFPLASEPQDTQKLRVRQISGGATSEWSRIYHVGKHTVDYPAGLPRPEIDPNPVHKCGSRTGVSNLIPGCEVWITASGIEKGRVSGASKRQGVNINPFYQLNEKVQAWATLCGDPSSPSAQHDAQPPPSPLPAPSFDEFFEDQERLRLTGLVNGARFEIVRNGNRLGPWRTWGQGHFVTVSPPIGPNERLEAVQMMCPGDQPSGAGTGRPRPCSDLPAPEIGPVQAGDRQIVVYQAVPGARIQVFRNREQLGDSAGRIIMLKGPVRRGDVLHVFQQLGNCTGRTARRVEVRCVAPPATGDPSDVNVYPVGHLEYAENVEVNGDTHRAAGIVYYPAEDDGEKQPFHKRLGELGRVPIVFMGHGNHYTWRRKDNHREEDCESNGDEWEEIPNHKGYEYLQRALARMGIVSVSVYLNPTNCVGNSVSNILWRSALFEASIVQLQKYDNASSSVFHEKIDFDRIGLFGHSRGGDAVVALPETNSLRNAKFAAVLSLAPTNVGASSQTPKVPAFMTILPAGDGDVVHNDGAVFYDKARPGWFKSQVYAHFTNHNYFNTQWPRDESLGPPALSRHHHERLVLAYGCAFFRAALLTDPTLGYLSGHVRPTGLDTTDIHLSFEQTEAQTVDHHENRGGIATNSFGHPTTQLMSLSADEFDLSQSGSNQFNGSFYGATTGMVATATRSSGTFRTELGNKLNLAGREIWIRAVEVYNPPNVPQKTTGFELGVEDTSGKIAWVDSDEVGGLPRPYDRRADDQVAFQTPQDFTKSMMKTLRFRADCFTASNEELELENATALRIRLNRNDGRALAFDILQIV